MRFATLRRRTHCTKQRSPKAKAHKVIVRGSGTATACTRIFGFPELPEREVNK